MSGSTRFYKNSYSDVLPDEPLLDSSNQLEFNIRLEIEKIFSRLNEILQKNLTSANISDTSVYTGITGFAYLFLMLADKEQNSSYLEKGLSLVEQSLKRLRGRDVTFLCGDIGPLCVAAVLRHRTGDSEGSLECINKVLAFLPRVLNLKSDLPNELLYGRVGYLYGLLFLRKNIDGIASILPIKEVVEAVIAAGRKDGNPPLMWSWHGKEYLGAAHGVSGIAYLLLQVSESLNPEQLSMIKRTIDFLLSIAFPSGNLPSSLGSKDDRLVHWCHGAPGFVQTLLSAYKLWKEDVYLKAAEKCGEVIWSRGLLRKGYGICHGVAGNAYSFLALFQATGDQLYLSRAIQFARWCDTYDRNQERPPDEPMSLFEGISGTVYFLKDIQSPFQALFPCYSIQSFHNTK